MRKQEREEESAPRAAAHPMVAPVVPQPLLAPPQVLPHHVSTVPRGMFECKACKKVFTSHQALGGHRASHKKVKGCFAAKVESNRIDPPQPIVASANDKVVGDAIILATVCTEQQNTTSVDGNVEGSMFNAETSVVVVAIAAPEMAAHEVLTTMKKGKVHECVTSRKSTK